MTEKPIGVILAGGLATRMGGGDKCLIEIAGRSLLARVIDRLAPQCDGLILNANGDPARFSAYGLPVVADGVTGYAGPLAGVLAGMEAAAAQGADAIVTAAGDTPFFPADLVARLREAAARDGTPLACAAAPDDAGKLWDHPTFGLWPTALAGDLRAALDGGLRKILHWTDGHGCARAVFDGGPPDPFFNVNTPEDRAEAARIAELA
ncbi:MAG: molybdenum cofactor guanylyltransferase MobA [Rubrimonas sp.]|uniref:molybdenum cofactor guanylyltransferase MobA n=1 Tax=Rubrimonas sp. TaxID=2036015 RepID=UPI002FDD4807